MVETLKQILLKDVSGANESARVSYIVRINSLIMTVYFVIWMFVFSISGRMLALGVCTFCMLAYLFSVFQTYRDRSMEAMMIYSGVTVFWMFVFVIQWGWECGIQHFVFVLLVQLFVGTYMSVREKLAASVVVFLVRMLLYVWHVTHAPMESLSLDISVAFQIINIAAVFMSMVVILNIFTRDKLATEAKLAKYNRQLKAVAEHDHLTKLLNRNSAMNDMVSKIQSGSLEVGICVAIGDIDFFKKVNDTYGHDAGDEVLRRLSSVFKEYMAPHGFAARWGGEEFLFVFEDENLDDAFVALEELRHKVSSVKIDWKETTIPVTMTFGASDVNVMFGAGEDREAVENNINEAISVADGKLYQGKESGRNKVVI